MCSISSSRPSTSSTYRDYVAYSYGKQLANNNVFSCLLNAANKVLVLTSISDNNNT